MLGFFFGIYFVGAIIACIITGLSILFDGMNGTAPNIFLTLIISLFVAVIYPLILIYLLIKKIFKKS